MIDLFIFLPLFDVVAFPFPLHIQFVTVEVISTALMDMFPKTLRKRKQILTLIYACFVASSASFVQQAWVYDMNEYFIEVAW